MRLTPLLLAATLLGVVPLSGCAGFKPLYAQSTVAALSRIDVRPPDGRLGYLLREQLDDAFGKAVGQPALYRLTFTSLDERRYPRGVRPDDTATRYELQVNAAYVVNEIASGREVGRGAQGYNLTYDSADPPYAGVAGQQDSQVRAAMEIAQRIRTELALKLAGLSATG